MIESPGLRYHFEVSMVEDHHTWDDFVRRLGGHVLQCAGWGELKSRFGWRVKRVMLREDGEDLAGAQILFRQTPLGQFAYVPRGPVADFQRPEVVGALFQAVHRVARNEGAFLLKIEPNQVDAPWAAAAGFQPTSQTVQPATTIVVPLAPDLKIIAMAQKPKTRYNIGLAGRRGVMVREGTLDDLPAFYEAMEITGRRDGFGIHALGYYRTVMEVLGENVRLFLAEFGGHLLGGIVVTCFGEEAIYMYGASTDRHRNLMPNHLLQWEALKWAKTNGAQSYDLWGIPDEVGLDPDPSVREAATGEESETRTGGLWGVYRFKQGFGGKVVRYSGAFDYSYSAARYLIWRRVLPLLRSQRAGGG